jgi:uncharacterized protein
VGDPVFSWWLLPLFLITAMLYSSVGHGGASAYLGIFVLTGYARPEIAPLVLVLNILVTTTGVVNYYQAGHFSFKLLLPFIATSIPAAFLGGMLKLSADAFSSILGMTLLAASLRFLFLAQAVEARPFVGSVVTYGAGLPIGFMLGFLAGLIGIGGGIFLSPLILFLGWADAKKTAAVSAGFIILNSTSGLMAHILRETMNWPLLIPLAIMVLIGGQLGSWWGAFRLAPVTLQRLLGIVLLGASLKLLGQLW